MNFLFEALRVDCIFLCKVTLLNYCYTSGANSLQPLLSDKFTNNLNISQVRTCPVVESLLGIELLLKGYAFISRGIQVRSYNTPFNKEWTDYQEELSLDG